MIGRRQMLAIAAGGVAVAALPAPTRARSGLRGIQVSAMRITINGREMVQGVDGYMTFRHAEAAPLVLPKHVEFTLQLVPTPGEPGLFRTRETRDEADARLLDNLKRRAHRLDVE